MKRCLQLLLNVENHSGAIPTLDLLHVCFVPGSRLNGATQIMSSSIVTLSMREGVQARLREVVNFKLAKDEVFGIEEKNQFIQPAYEQRDGIVAFHANLSTDMGAYLFRRHHQALHALSHMRKKLV